MRPRATASALLFMALACLWLPLGAWGQQQRSKPWTWTDRDGNVRSRADLDEILKQHKLWLESATKSGARANLEHTDLIDANLTGVHLELAHLRGAVLIDAVLNGADLTFADLTGANLMSANLRGAHLDSADLNGATLWRAHLTNANLSGADLAFADLAGAYFEPKNLPKVERIALAGGLEWMRYLDNPGPLTQLRKQFQDGGYREQERQITYVLNREEAKRASFVERWFKRIAFDYTCQYGLSPGRPLRIVFWLWLAFAVVYAVFMHRLGSSGIYFIGSRASRGRSNTQGLQIRPRAIRAGKWWKLPFRWLGREGRVWRAALFFSLMSAFNLGFRDINFGRWLRMLTTREYDLKAVGWARTVSGFQSLLSVYLIALWVLTYFGRPFG